jgi:hypothetical protein
MARKGARSHVLDVLRRCFPRRPGPVLVVFPTRALERQRCCASVDFPHIPLTCCWNAGRHYTSRSARGTQLEDICRRCGFPGSCVGSVVLDVWLVYAAVDDQRFTLTHHSPGNVRVRWTCRYVLPSGRYLLRKC